MIAVIFEVVLKSGKTQQYLDIAANLKPLLAEIEGFISIERFASLQDKNKVLSLSFWKNEEAINKWRNMEMHRQGQAEGMATIFSDYRIRIGQIIRDYGINERDQTPKDSNNYHQ